MSGRARPSMKRTTVMLPVALRRRAVALARERGLSLGALIRESLDSALSTSLPTRVADSLFTGSVSFTGKAPKDLSAAHDRYVYSEDA